MESLSRNKLRQEVQSMRPSIARGRVHLCRKIIADIKKLTKKKVNDQLKNEKNIRKIQRLTNEVHELKQLKPNAIAEFALSHTVESVEALRENPDISSRNRVLAKLSLHKLIKPLVETFHKSYPKWQELLPKLLDKNAVEIGVTGSKSSANEANDVENSISSDCHISSDYDSNNLSLKSSDINKKKFKDVHDPKSSADTSLVKLENLGVSKVNNKITEKKVIISKKSPTKSPLNLKKCKLKLLKTPSSAHRTGIKWDVQNTAELTSTTEQICVNTLEQNKDEIERKDEYKTDNEQKMAEGNLGETNRTVYQTNDKLAIISSDEEYQLDKKDISLKNLNRKDKRSASSIESTDFIIPRNKKSSDFPLKAEEEESDSDVENTDTMSHNNGPAKSLKIKSEEKSDMFPPNKIKKLSSNLDKMENISPSTQVQQHEDPFFLTKDNDKYLTFGKIVQESKEEPLLKTKELKISTKSWDNRKSFNNLRKEGKFQRSNKFGKFGGPNNRNESFPEINIKLHPSWEARKKISTILPFEGKKISFDD